VSGRAIAVAYASTREIDRNDQVETAILLHPPYFLVATVKFGGMAGLRRALWPRNYKAWLTLLRDINPYLFDGRKRGLKYDAIVHVVLSIDGTTINPCLAIQSIPVLNSYFKSLYPSELDDEI
jgi:hypothetical protein